MRKTDMPTSVLIARLASPFHEKSIKKCMKCPLKEVDHVAQNVLNDTN